MPNMDEACSGSSVQLKQPTTSPLLMKVKLGRPRKGTVAPTACLSEDDKKGRRRAANRESARRMRARRAENVAQLTSQVAELRNKCERLQNHNQAIRLNWKKVALENHRLRAQFLAMQGDGSLPSLPPPTTLPPEIDDGIVPPFEDDGPLSTGQHSSTNETDLLSCLTPAFHSSPDPSSQPAVSSPGPAPQQVPQLTHPFSPPCSPSSSHPLLPETISPFSSVPQTAPAEHAAPAAAPPSSPSVPRLKPPRPQSASLPPQWGVNNPALQGDTPMPTVAQTASVTPPTTIAQTNSSSHGTVILDPLPTVTSTSASPMHSQPQSTQPPPTFSHPLTLRTHLLADHPPPSLFNPIPTSHAQLPTSASWNPPANPATTLPPPALPNPLDPLDATFPWAATSAPPHAHPHSLAPTLRPVKDLDPMPSLAPFPRSFSKQLESMPSLGPGDPLSRLMNSWDILSCLPPAPPRQHSLEHMSSMGSLPLLDDQPGFFAADLHPPQGQDNTDSQPGQVPMLSKLSTPPMFFR